MQLQQAQNSQEAGRLSLEQGVVIYDSTIAKWCDLDPSYNRVDLSEFAQTGAQFRALHASGAAPVGSWLADLLERATRGRVQARASDAASRMLEAAGGDSTLCVVHDDHYAEVRRARHDQRNLINAIQMNAELLKVLVAREGMARVGDIADKILNECRRFEFDGGPPAPHSPERSAGWQSREEARLLFDATLECAALFDAPAIRIDLPDRCPNELLSYILTYLAAIKVAGWGTFPLMFGQTSDNILTIEVPIGAVDSAQLVVPPGHVSGAVSALSSRSLLSPTTLPAAVDCYLMELGGNVLSLRFGILD